MTVAKNLTTALKLQQNGQFAEAEAAYRALLQQNPQQPDICYLLGISCAQQQKYQDACHFLQQAILLAEDQAHFWSALGNVQKQMQQYDKALGSFQTALILDATNPSIHNNLGTLYHRLKKMPLARAAFSKAIQLKNNYADAHFNLGLLYLQQAQRQKAQLFFEKTLAIDPQYTNCHRYLGQLNMQQEKITAAIAHYQKALALDAQDAESEHLLASCYQQQHKASQAILHYRKALVLDPKHWQSWHNLATLHLLKRDFTQALSCYHQALALAQDADSYYNSGVIYLYQERHDDAINYLQQALKKQADYPSAHYNIATAYLKKNKPQQAIDHYKKALAHQPDNEEIAYILAGLQQQQHYKQTPGPYVCHLFDEYAAYFDQHLTRYLHYQVPQAIAALLGEHYSAEKKLDLIDLGCGTGLCGERLKPYAAQLIGVDLSAKMLAIAKQKNCYQQLVQQDMMDFLVDKTAIDGIIAADVLGYIGELTTLFQRVQRSLKPGGFFIFSSENTTCCDYQLQTNLRFSHHADYILHQAEKLFQLKAKKTITLRQQNKKPLAGCLWFFVKQENLG